MSLSSFSTYCLTFFVQDHSFDYKWPKGGSQGTCSCRAHMDMQLRCGLVADARRLFSEMREHHSDAPVLLSSMLKDGMFNPAIHCYEIFL
jgi:hypothetical protein